MNDDIEEYLDSFESFVDRFNEEWKELIELSKDKVDTEAYTLATAANNFFQWGDVWDGVGQGGRVDIEGTFGKLKSYIDECCFPDVTCTDIAKAVDSLDKARDKFEIELEVERIRTGLDSWNTSDRAVNNGSVLGVSWGPAEIFKTNYIDTISEMRDNSRELIREAQNRLEEVLGVVYFNRGAIIKIVSDTKKALDDYNPVTAWALASIQLAFTAAGFSGGPIGAMAAGIGGYVSVKVLEELGVVSGACVVELVDGLRESVGKLHEECANGIEKVTKENANVYGDAHDNDGNYVCKRPSRDAGSKSDDSPPVIY